MSDNEKKLILEMIKYNINEEKIIKLISDNNINWINVLGFISYHRIAGLIYEKINKINIRLLEFPVFFSIYMINQAQKERNDYQLSEIKKIAQELNKRKIKYIFLKGSILNNTIFNPGTRASNDIDILINSNSINNATEALKKIGYVQGKYNYKKNTIEKFDNAQIETSIKTRGETCPFVKTVNAIGLKTLDVDLNFSIDWTPNYHSKLIDEILENRIAIQIDNITTIYSANVYHNIIELCTHLYKDMALIDIIKKRKVFDLYKLIDVYYYICTNYNKIDFTILKNEIKLFNAEKYVFFALKYLSELFDDFNSKEIIDLMHYLETKVNNLEVLNTIFDQYNTESKLSTTLNLKDRIFEYDVIKKYNGE